MPDDPENDLPLPEVLEQLLGGLDRDAVQNSFNRFGLVAEIVEDYSSFKSSTRGIDLSRIPEVLAVICPEGQPARLIDKSEVAWRQGLGSFCMPDAEDVFGEIASAHLGALTAIIGRWSDHEMDLVLDRTLDPAHAERRGAFLAPSLPIHEREFLAQSGIDAVLKPIHLAQIECRQVLYRAIRETHLAGRWVGFRPTHTGSYALIATGSGFDGNGDYSVDRSTYLRGFGYAEDEVDAGFRHRPPYKDQDNWLFFDAARLRLIAPRLLKANSPPKANGPGRKSLNTFDLRFVREAEQLLVSGFASKKAKAAQQVVDKWGSTIRGNSREAKIRRISRKMGKLALERDEMTSDPSTH